MGSDSSAGEYSLVKIEELVAVLREVMYDDVTFLSLLGLSPPSITTANGNGIYDTNNNFNTNSTALILSRFSSQEMDELRSHIESIVVSRAIEFNTRQSVASNASVMYEGWCEVMIG